MAPGDGPRWSWVVLSKKLQIHDIQLQKRYQIACFDSDTKLASDKEKPMNLEFHESIEYLLAIWVEDHSKYKEEADPDQEEVIHANHPSEIQGLSQKSY